jgi:organic hydroperoxide reductase OsmC/OhrA
MDGVTVEWTGNRGDAARWNPEDILLASLSACLKLWCLGLCAGACISVVSYRGEAEATIVEDPKSAGRFVDAALRPRIAIQPDGDIATAPRRVSIALSPIRCIPP